MQVGMSRSAQRSPRGAPYALVHGVSLERALARGAPPHTLAGLLHWFAVAWQAELPERIHVMGVWVGPQERDQDGVPRWPPELLGGSALGAAPWSDAFRRWLTDHPGQTDQDGRYRTPLRAALWRLAGRGSLSEDRPFMARFLWRLGLTIDGLGQMDIWAVPSTIPPQVVRIYAEVALGRLWAIYREQPEARMG